jgi:CDP-6-deoxy-D-xylo-4-hexulose-3-dehydrase
MKLPEANAAFGREQMKRLPWIVSERKRIHDYIGSRVGFNVETVKGAEPSWFGVCMTHPKRNEIGALLEGMGVRHRPFFAGNITRHPPYTAYRGHFPVADYLMKSAYFVGCWPGMTQEQMDYVVSAINSVKAGPGYE